MLGLTSALSSSSEKEQNYALSFDGVNDYVDLGPSNGIITASQDPVSCSCWVKTTTTSTGYIFSCQKGAGSSAFSVNINANGTARGVVWKGASAHSFPNSTTAVNDGNWHHVAVVAKNNSQKIYVDGSLEGEQTQTMDLPTSTDHCSIGAHDAGASNRYDGSLTGLAVYTVELDADAITSIYSAGRHHNLNTPIGNYSSTPSHYYALGHGLFDDKANGVVHDQANPGFGTELTVNGNFSTSDLSSFSSIYATISIDNERLKVVPHAGEGYALARVTWSSQVGDVFLVKATAYKGNATNTVIKTHSGITIDNISKTDDEWTYEAYGVATSTQSIIRLQVTGADGVYGYFDNVSVKKINDAEGTITGATFVADN